MIKKKTLTVALAFGLPWAIIMIAFNAVMNGEVTLKGFIITLILGMVAGFAFALAMQAMANRFLKKTIIFPDADEAIIREGGANHFRGLEAVGGKLALTDKRIVFKSHKLNIQNHQQSFELGHLESIQATKTWKLFNNGLSLQLANQEVHRFVVDAADEWVAMIEKQRSLAGSK